MQTIFSFIDDVFDVAAFLLPSLLSLADEVPGRAGSPCVLSPDPGASADLDRHEADLAQFLVNGSRFKTDG